MAAHADSMVGTGDAIRFALTSRGDHLRVLSVLAAEVRTARVALTKVMTKLMSLPSRVIFTTVRLIRTGKRGTHHGQKNSLHLKAEYIDADYSRRPQCLLAFMRRTIHSVYKSSPAGRKTASLHRKRLARDSFGRVRCGCESFSIRR